MKNNTKISLALAAMILVQSIGGGLAYADPTGTVTYNGQTIQVTNGQFMLNGVPGTINDQGIVNYNGQAKNLTEIEGVSAYQIQGQAAVPVTPTVVTPAQVPTVAAPTGTVTYNGQSIQVTNGRFTLNGKSGTIDANGMVTYDGQTKNLKEIAGVTAYQVQGQAVVPVTQIPTYTSTMNKLSCKDYPNICNSDLTIGTRIGDTLTITSQQLKDYFATNPTPQDIIKMASEKKMTTSQVAQAFSIAKGVAYDPTAMLNFVRDYPGYALGPDNIIVKLQAGQTKRASDGMLEGTWSSDPGRVSYTEWARAWYCAGNGDVNGGKVDYGRGATTQQCDGSSGTSTFGGATGTYGIIGVPLTNGSGVIVGNTAGGNAGSTLYIHPRAPLGNETNPYASSFSSSNITTLDTWITNKIRAKASTVSAADYATFINTLVTKVTTLKNSMTDQTKVAILNYILYEVTVIQNGLSVNST